MSHAVDTDIYIYIYPQPIVLWIGISTMDSIVLISLIRDIIWSFISYFKCRDDISRRGGECHGVRCQCS